MNDYNFGNFVCFLREKKGLTQADVASTLGVTPAAVSKWETGASKPRVEVLFELAKILDARPEELMAGRYIPEETLDPEAVKRINERYEYLRKIDSHATANVKIRRMLAWVVDWMISGFFTMILTFVVIAILIPRLPLTGDEGFAVTFVIMMNFSLFAFILRDLIFGGQSIGKRITGLLVLDKRTAEKAKLSQTVIRNLFLFILQFDLVLMLIRGESIGDMAAHTAVVFKKEWENSPSKKPIDIEKINTYESPQARERKKTAKLIIIVGLIIIWCFLFITGIVALALNASKNTEEYQLAYTYLVESEEFTTLGVSEDEVVLNSTKTMIDATAHSKRSKHFGFYIGSLREMTVVCHMDGDTWYVCEDCTHFE